MVDPLMSTMAGLAPIALEIAKSIAINQLQRGVVQSLDDRKYGRHVELAFKNAFEYGLIDFSDATTRDRYRDVINSLTASGSDVFRQEALKLFTLAGKPDYGILNEKYNVGLRISDAAKGVPHTDIDTTPFLEAFFQALVQEFYNDPVLRPQVSDVLQTQAALQSQRTLSELLTALRSITDQLSACYTMAQFEQDLMNYVDFIEKRLRFHRFAGVILSHDEEKSPEVESIFVPILLAPRKSSSVADAEKQSVDKMITLSPYLLIS